MFKKAIRLQKLSEYFKNERLPRNSIIIFVFCYVMRSLLQIVHGGWAIKQYSNFINNIKTSADVMQQYATNELFLAIEECINVFTILMIIVFFMLLGRNRRRLRENLRQLSYQHSTRSFSMSDLDQSHQMSSKHNNEFTAVDENSQRNESTSSNGFGKLNSAAIAGKMRKPRPSEVLNRDNPLISKLTSEGKQSNGSDHVSRVLDDVFDTVGTDEVESQYFEPPALLGYQPSGSYFHYSRKKGTGDNFSSEMSLN